MGDLRHTCDQLTWPRTTGLAHGKVRAATLEYPTGNKRLGRSHTARSMWMPVQVPCVSLPISKFKMFLFRHCRSASFSRGRAFASLAPHRARLQSTPTIIKPSNLETQKGFLEPRNLEKAVGALHRDGLVVVEEAIPHDALDRLNTKMVQDARVLQSRGEDGPFNYNTGNLQQDAPPVAEHFSPAIFTSTWPWMMSTPPSPK